MQLFKTPNATLTPTVSAAANVLIIGLSGCETEQKLVGGAALATEQLLATAKELGACSKVGNAVQLPQVEGKKIIVTGLGEGTACDLRKAAGVAARKARSLGKDEAVTVAVDFNLTDPALVQATAEGALLGLYEFAKISGEETKAPIAAVEIVAAEAEITKLAVSAASGVAYAVNVAREWVNIPANYLYPETFAASAAAEAEQLGIKVEIMDEKELEAKGFGGIVTVGRGSEHKPRLLRLEYAPEGATFHLALVGKGMTFDTGGLNLKPANGMYTMKCDMGGAATVLGAILGIAKLGLKIKVTCYASMAENTPSSTAYRPSDVLTMYGGKTVENANSDAEGRLVMADAIVRAGEDKPNMIIDCATLTGACVVGLGDFYAGVMSNDELVAKQVLSAAETAGEGFWQLPMHPSFVDSLKSDVADIKSSGARTGGAMAAATFLQQFLPENMPWAHLDIAGPAWNDSKPEGHIPSGGTGHGVRTLVALAQNLQG